MWDTKWCMLGIWIGIKTLPDYLLCVYLLGCVCACTCVGLWLWGGCCSRTIRWRGCNGYKHSGNLFKYAEDLLALCNCLDTATPMKAFAGSLGDSSIAYILFFFFSLSVCMGWRRGGGGGGANEGKQDKSFKAEYLQHCYRLLWLFCSRYRRVN